MCKATVLKCTNKTSSALRVLWNSLVLFFLITCFLLKDHIHHSLPTPFAVTLLPHLLWPSCWSSCLAWCRWSASGWWRHASPPGCSDRTPGSPPLGCSVEDGAVRSLEGPLRHQMFHWLRANLGLKKKKAFRKPDYPTNSCTHHLKPFNQGAEVWVFLVVLDENRLHAFPCALDVDAWPIHLSQIYSLQVS